MFVKVEWSTLNGPWCRAASFNFGCVVRMLVPYNHMSSPSLNICDGVFGLVHFISSAATLRAAVTLSWTWFIVRSHSSTVGIVVAKFTGGINSGWYPYHT